MGAGHAHPLYLPGTSPLHRARPQCKIAATLLFVLAVVATPREAFWAFGVYALGLNIINMALITAWGGYAVFRLLRRALPATKTGVTISAGVAAGISVVLASLAFVVEYAIGGNGGASVGTVFAAMVGVHTLIGIGEGIITALTVGVVLGVRPDLVYGAADLQTPLVLGPKPGGTVEEVR